MSTKTYCALCSKELKRNVTQDRLVVEFKGFRAEVVITKDDSTSDSDLCLECLLNALNAKLKRKYIRKPKTVPEQVSVPGAAPIQAQTKKPTSKRAAINYPLADGKPDISTFSLKTRQGNNPNEFSYDFSLGEVTVSHFKLKDGVIELLNLAGITQADVEDAPDSEGKRQILGILNAEGKGG